MNKPQFKRILVSRSTPTKKESWERKEFKDEILERTFTLVDCGDECTISIKNLVGKQVILSDISGVKINEKEEIEYFILPQETILCEASN